MAAIKARGAGRTAPKTPVTASKASVEVLPAPTIEGGPLKVVPSLQVTRADVEADWDDAAMLAIETLPSGKRVEVHPVSLLSMLANKTLPNSLLAAAKRQLNLSDGDGTAPPSSGAEDGATEEDSTLEQMKLVDFMVCQMCATPCFVSKARADCQPGERSIFEMSDSDKMHLFQLAMTGQRALKSDR